MADEASGNPSLNPFNAPRYYLENDCPGLPNDTLVTLPYRLADKRPGKEINDTAMLVGIMLEFSSCIRK